MQRFQWFNRNGGKRRKAEDGAVKNGGGKQHPIRCCFLRLTSLATDRDRDKSEARFKKVSYGNVLCREVKSRA